MQQLSGRTCVQHVQHVNKNRAGWMPKMGALASAILFGIAPMSGRGGEPLSMLAGHCHSDQLRETAGREYSRCLQDIRLIRPHGIWCVGITACVTVLVQEPALFGTNHGVWTCCITANHFCNSRSLFSFGLTAVTSFDLLICLHESECPDECLVTICRWSA